MNAYQLRLRHARVYVLMLPCYRFAAARHTCCAHYDAAFATLTLRASTAMSHLYATLMLLRHDIALPLAPSRHTPTTNALALLRHYAIAITFHADYYAIFSPHAAADAADFAPLLLRWRYAAMIIASAATRVSLPLNIIRHLLCAIAPLLMRADGVYAC